MSGARERRSGVRRAGAALGRPAAVFAVVCFVGIAAAPPWASGEELSGRTVVSLAYRCDGPLDRADVERLIGIRVGLPLTETQTASTVRNLFATREFRDVLIEAEPADGGLAVEVRLFRAYRTYPIHFAGRRGLSREELRRALPFFAGSVYSEEDVGEGAKALERKLVAEGFPRAKVRPEVAFDRRRFDAEVTYHVDAGERARVAPMLFEGKTDPFSAAELAKHARRKPGDRYKESTAEADAGRMREFLHTQGRLRASVELIAAQPTEDGRIAPVYRVVVGPVVSFVTEGLSAKSVRRDMHDLLEGQGFDEDVVLQYVDREKRLLQEKGYYKADVTYSLDQKPDETTVSIRVVPGRKYSVAKIVFSGNASVPDKSLRRIMVTTPRGLPLLRPGRVVDDELRQDVGALLGYYQSHGWISARVGPAQVTASSADRLVVTIPIEEGPRVLVAKRELEGVEHADRSHIEKLLRLKAGEPFNPNRLADDVGAIRAYYQDRGWLEVAVRDEYRAGADGRSVDVTYRVDEGERSFFGETIVRGNARTRTGRIRRLISWTEGAPFSEEKILELQRKLARTGAFQRVEVRPEPADPANRERNVEVEVQEAGPLSLLYGFGYQYVPDAAENQNDPFVVGGVSTHNLFGGMRSAGIEAQIALSGRFRIQASFRDPFLIHSDYPFTSVLFASRETIQNIDLDRIGFANEVSRVFGEHLRLSLRAEYQRIRPVNPRDISSIEIEQFPRADQPIEEATVGPTLLYDRRDDVVDPHRGYYVSLAGKYAFPLFSAEARYTKFAAQATRFQPLGRAVFAVSARFGGIFPYGSAEIPVPIAERFFVGGRSTERAFQTDLLGVAGNPGAPPGSPDSLENATVDYSTQAVRRNPPDGKGSCAKSFPELADYDCTAGPRVIGGNGFVSLNAELRFPIAGSLGGVLFYDAAQVWRNFSSMTLRFERSDGLRQGVGFGLWYMLPIGPIRAEYAFRLHRRTIPFDVLDVTDPQHPIVLDHSQTKESAGQFFVSIGFPF